MKKILLALIGLIITLAANAQSPQAYKYQGIARNSNGNVVAGQPISLRITIHQGSIAGFAIYKETHVTSTNQFGAFNINVGTGNVVTGNFSTIRWDTTNYFQQVELDITGGTSYVSMGTSQLLSVPYALYSRWAGDANYAESADSALWANNAGHALRTDTAVWANTAAFAGNGGFSNFQVFDATGSYTIPAGVTKILVEVWGAGGAGGAVSGNTGGSGGGGGGYGKQILNVVPGTYPITIGSGGLGIVNGAGTIGGTSSFGAFISASGGTGGLAGSGHGCGGSSSGTFNITGGCGQNGSNGNFPGSGGPAACGGPGGPGGGSPGISPGGGGSGTGVPGTAGGNGANGRVVVWW